MGDDALGIDDPAFHKHHFLSIASGVVPKPALMRASRKCIKAPSSSNFSCVV
jgi:hypothetical protein